MNALQQRPVCQACIKRAHPGTSRTAVPQLVLGETLAVAQAAERVNVPVRSLQPARASINSRAASQQSRCECQVWMFTNLLPPARFEPGYRLRPLVWLGKSGHTHGHLLFIMCKSHHHPAHHHRFHTTDAAGAMMLAQLLRTTARRASQASLACRLVAPASKSFATDAAAAAQKPSGGGGGVVRTDAPYRFYRKAAHPVVRFGAVQASGVIFPVTSCPLVCAATTKLLKRFQTCAWQKPMER